MAFFFPKRIFFIDKPSFGMYTTHRNIVCFLETYILFHQGGLIMQHNNPLLLLDNSSMMTVIGEGQFTSRRMSFEETHAVLETFDDEDVRIGFSNSDITNIIFPYIGLTNKNYRFKEVRHMHVGQEALVFKLYVTPSETQPITHMEDGTEAKKIQNVYVYCQYITRTA